MKAKILSASLLLTALLCGSLRAQTTVNWNNATGTSWNNASNWNPTTAYPNGTSYIAQFNTASVIPNGTISLGTSITLQELAFGATTARTVTFDGGGAGVNSLTLSPASFGVGLAITGAAHNITFDSDVNITNTSASSGTYLTIGDSAAITFASGYTLALQNGTSLTISRNSSDSTTGTVNLNGNFNAGTATQGLIIADGTVNWDVGTYTSSSTNGQAIAVQGFHLSATLNFEDSFTSTTQGIGLGYGTSANSIARVYGTANGVQIASAIASNAAGTGGLAANVVVVGANDATATSASPSTVAFSGTYAISTNANTRTNQFFAYDNNVASFTGVISGSASGSVFQKTGNGTVIFGGSSANTYSSAVPMEVVAGTLKLAKTSGVALTGSVTVDSGATLLLGGSSQTTAQTAMTLAGGTFAAGGYSDTLGTLTLTANSFLTLNSSTQLAFANSASTLGNFTLTITGPLGATGLRFGTDGTGLSAGELADIAFVNYDGLGDNANGATIDSFGYVTAAVPEGSTLALFLVGAAAFVASRSRKAAWAR